MTEVVKKLLITNPGPSSMLHLCRLCGRYSWNMTSIFDITNRYDYSKVINLHFRDFNISPHDELPLKMCIQCVATITAWHEFYNGCVDVNRRLKAMKLKLVRENVQENVADSNNRVENFILPDAPNDNVTDSSDMTNSSAEKPLRRTKPNSAPQSKFLGQLPLEVDLTVDDDSSVEFKHDEDSENSEFKHFDDLKQFADENYERDVSFAEDVEVIEIKMNDEDKEMETDDLFDVPSCSEDLFDDIENVRIQEDTSSLTPSENVADTSAIPETSVPDKTLDTEEMAILQNDLNTMVKDPVASNETRNTVEQPSALKHDKPNKLRRSTVCRICGKLYVTRTSYLRHLLKMHSGHSAARASRPAGRPPSEAQREAAGRAKEEPSRTMCDACGKTFRFASSYRKHYRDFHTEQPPRPKPARSRRMCDLCGKLCSGGSFKGHMKKHTNPESVTCPHCGQLFSFESVLKSHIKVRHSAERPFRCELCDSSFKRADYLRSHMRYKHEPKLLRGETTKKRTPRPRSASWTSPFAFRCGECDASFKNKEALDRHLNQRLPEEGAGEGGAAAPKCPSVFRCELCDTTFKKRNYLTLHKRYVHDKRQPFRISESSVGPYKCDRCERRFASVCGRNYHCKSVHGSLFESKFFETCEHCGLTFKNRVFYAKHCAKLRDKPTCYLCWSAFDEEAALKQHMHDVHVDDLPFWCELCGRRFVTLRQLHDHIKSRHAKIRPFKCSYCAHTAVRKDSLEVHIRGCHLGQKPYKCDLCDKAFSQSSDVRKHRVTHTRNRLTQAKKKKMVIEEAAVFVKPDI